MDFLGTWESVLSIGGIILAIFGILATKYYYDKSEKKFIKALETERARIKEEYSNFLAKNLVKMKLEEEEIILSRETVKLSILGKFNRTNILSEPNDKEIDEIITRTYSIIEEQEFVSTSVKRYILESLSKTIQQQHTLKSETIENRSEISNYQHLIDISSTQLLYILSGFSCLLLIIYYGISHYGIKSEFLMSVLIMVFIAIPFMFMANMPFNFFNPSLSFYFKLHSYFNIGLVTVLMLIGKTLNKNDPLYNVFSNIIMWSLATLPISYFLFITIKKFKKKD
ncbi:hypothetical protein [Desulfosporosinus meridiei]|uniref:Uncharacterized protein n=1 Tax=Desulfosporosinus meridiei (strain ATCC BAA-275 / DSM 13257 / KCTC 12902 / NCIMB 13706 / S10) TaxID=768704 RepID=J7IWS1_DESMD|nr:hypothetical protein [Desulfosporosinus meridiei]AFQ46277.1 hypothetical protein Desmer_4471 [Desulfosporosinus meridiei DSM 13257]